MIALLNPRNWKTLGIGLVGLFFWGGAAWGQSPLLTLQPSNLQGLLAPGGAREGFIHFGCYDLFTLMRVNCEVTATLAPLDPATTQPQFFGGHRLHNTADQPVGTVRNANIQGAGGPSVTGQTLEGFTVAYTAPEASGEVQLLTTWTPPPFYLCQDNDEENLGPIRRPCTGINHFNIGLPLRALDPLDDTFYKVIRGDADRHPSGTSGTPDTINKLRSLAGLYSAWTFRGDRLSVNDISLPQGGLFDWKTDWVVPHRTHRRGTDVDINVRPVDVNGIPVGAVPCPDDFALQLALEEVATTSSGSPPRLLCELNGRPDPEGPQKHISF